MSLIFQEEVQEKDTAQGGPERVVRVDREAGGADPGSSVVGLRALALTAPALALVLVLTETSAPASVLVLVAWASVQVPLMALLERRQLQRATRGMPGVGELVELGTRAEAAEAALRKDEELLHELRATVVGITMAHRLLSTSGDEIRDTTRQRLTQLQESELARLERLVVGVPERTSDDIDLHEVVRPLADAIRLRGQEVECRGPSARVFGRPDDVSEIVHVLLQNAARHASGSAVNVTVFRTSTTAGLAVTDEGPGVPAALVPTLFDRGVRGPGSAGQGLGLHIARELAADMGGDLHLEPKTRGASFVLTLPVSPRHSQGAAPCLAHSG